MDRDAARRLLTEIGAPARLLRHVELVGEAGDALLSTLAGHSFEVRVDESFVRAGIVLHDAGKVLHPAELEGSGSAHEPAGERLLLSRGVSPALARVCRSHAQWQNLECSLEELLIALADKLWKGVRKAELEELAIRRVAEIAERDYWDTFVILDGAFEAIANGGDTRLRRSQP